MRLIKLVNSFAMYTDYFYKNVKRIISSDLIIFLVSYKFFLINPLTFQWGLY